MYVCMYCMYVCDRMVITKVFSYIVPQSTRHLAIPREREHVRPYKALSIHTLPPFYCGRCGVHEQQGQGDQLRWQQVSGGYADVLYLRRATTTCYSGNWRFNTHDIYMYSYVCIHVGI
jgi:hypothetical protein